MYVTIIGGRSFPLDIFQAGKRSAFFDGVVHHLRAEPAGSAVEGWAG